jgi:outer membrane murein-binding lipoprotein Lpp
MRIFAVFIGFLVLSGCAEYDARQNEARMMDHHLRCKSYGLEVGSPAYAGCMENQDNQDQANRRVVLGALLSQPQPQPYILRMPAAVQPAAATIQQPRNCISTVNGQTIYTNCN